MRPRPDAAGRELKRARKLASMPATADALAQGKLSTDYADLIAGANQPCFAELFARDETLLFDTMSGLRHRDAQQVVQ